MYVIQPEVPLAKLALLKRLVAAPVQTPLLQTSPKLQLPHEARLRALPQLSVPEIAPQFLARRLQKVASSSTVHEVVASTTRRSGATSVSVAEAFLVLVTRSLRVWLPALSTGVVNISWSPM